MGGELHVQVCAGALTHLEARVSLTHKPQGVEVRRQLVEISSLLPHVGPKDQTPVIYPLSHYGSPSALCLEAVFGKSPWLNRSLPPFLGCKVSLFPSFPVHQSHGYESVGSKLRSSCLYSKCFTHRAVSPANELGFGLVSNHFFSYSLDYH